MEQRQIWIEGIAYDRFKERCQRVGVPVKKLLGFLLSYMDDDGRFDNLLDCHRQNQDRIIAEAKERLNATDRQRRYD